MTVYKLNKTPLFHEAGKLERKAKLKLLTYNAKKCISQIIGIKK